MKLMKLNRAINKGAVDERDKFVVYDMYQLRVIESHETLGFAIHARNNLNAHALRCCNKTKYKQEP